MPLRTVTGQCNHPDGTPWVGGEVSFHLTTAFETGTEVYPSERHVETLDALGQFSITLGVPSTGTAEYSIGTPDHLYYTAYIPDGPATTLQTLITIAGTSVAPSALQTLLDAAEVLTIRNVALTGNITAADEYIRASGTITLTLPAATGSGVQYTVKNVGVGVITLAAAGGQTIDGVASQLIPSLNRMTVADGAAGAWDILGG